MLGIRFAVIKFEVSSAYRCFTVQNSGKCFHVVNKDIKLHRLLCSGSQSVLRGGDPRQVPRGSVDALRNRKFEVWRFVKNNRRISLIGDKFIL